MGIWYYFNTFVWGGSSVGRASRSQRGGQGFESPSLHHMKNGDETLILKGFVAFFVF